MYKVVEDKDRIQQTMYYRLLKAYVTYDSKGTVLTMGTPAASSVLRLPPSMQDLY